MVELMVVISVIAILAGLMTAALGTSFDSGKITDTRGNISKIEIALSQYDFANSEYPSYGGILANVPQLEKLLAYEKFETVDAWGNELRYISHDQYINNLSSVAKKIGTGAAATFYNHRSFQIISAGPDGEFGTYPNTGGIEFSGEATDNLSNFSEQK